MLRLVRYCNKHWNIVSAEWEWRIGKLLQVAKSSSVNPRLIDLAEESTASSTAALNEMSSSDEFSSLSGYESIGNEEDIQGA